MEIWQFILSLIVVVSTGVASLISTSNKIEAQGIEIQNMKQQIYNMQLGADKKYDKMDTKLDAIQSDITTIKVSLQNKADRK